MIKLLFLLLGYMKLLIVKLMKWNGLFFNGIIKVELSSRIELLMNGIINIKDHTSIGKDCELASVNGNLTIGKYVHLGDYNIVISRENIVIGDNSIFGPHVYIYDHDHKIDQYKGVMRSEYDTSPVKIGKNVWIGANTVVLKGTTIGDNCVIAAGSIVHGNIPDNSIYIQKRNTEIKNKQKID